MGTIVIGIAFATSTPQSSQTVVIPLEPTLQERADAIATEYGIATTTLRNLVTSENTHWQPDLISPTGDYGLAAINLYWHPEVTKEQAFDPEFALRFAANEIKKDGGSKYTVCNCYSFVKVMRDGDLPKTTDIIPNATPAPGAVAILNYNGVLHYAYVNEVEDNGFWVREANYVPCLTGKRFIVWGDESLVGFWNNF